MKIIKSGNLPKEVKGVCPLCGCEFIAEKDDMQCKFGINGMTGTPIILDAWVPCPECGCNTGLDMSVFAKLRG